MEKSANTNGAQPITYQALAKLPAALAPLAARSQWCVWRWVQQADGRWSKPPFQARDPQKHASTKDPDTWADYAAARAAVQAGQADGISYVLTEEDPLAAADLDHCRDAGTGSVDEWAQNLLDQADDTYSEITPSGSGLRIWGTAAGNSLHRKFTLDTGKDAALELFRRTHKALTVTGLALGRCRRLGNIDPLLDRACLWAERHKAVAITASTNGSSFGGNGTGAGYSVDQIEQIVRTGAPDGTNRSNLFHTIVGHYCGCGWTAEQILTHLQQFPNGIAERYFREDRLAREIERSVSKYAAIKLSLFDTGAWTSNWPAKAAQPELQDPELEEQDPGPQVEQDLGLDEEQPPEPKDADDLQEQAPDEEPDPDKLDDEELASDSDLPPLYAHGDLDPRPLKSWLIKGLIPVCGHGLLSGQWGTYKSFVALELAAALITGQPFLGCMIKRQCGVLFLAAEGADEMRLRLNAIVREKCGAMPRAPFRWYETAPVLLQPGAVDKLVAMAKQAEASLQAEFGLPLGLVIIDTIAASAGYAQQGAESDNAVGQHVMNVLKALAQKLSCFTLGVDHFGKNINTGTRGGSSKEGSGDLVLACLGDRELNGRVINTRLAVRKCRGGPQGQEFYFTARKVEDPERDEDGDPITTLVIDWKSGPEPAAAQGQPDPWQSCRRSDQQTAVTRLKRMLMAVLAERGVDLPTTPDGPTVRMVDREIVREEFYAHTSADGTPKQKRDFRHAQFKRALDWAEQQQLVGVLEVNDVIYLWLMRPDPSKEGEEGV